MRNEKEDEIDVIDLAKWNCLKHQTHSHRGFFGLSVPVSLIMTFVV